MDKKTIKSGVKVITLRLIWRKNEIANIGAKIHDVMTDCQYINGHSCLQ